MFKEIHHFDNNEGLGGVEKGAYDKEAYYPCEVNWTKMDKNFGKEY